VPGEAPSGDVPIEQTMRGLTAFGYDLYAVVVIANGLFIQNGLPIKEPIRSPGDQCITSRSIR
jgi:hypothetical protein